MFDSVITTFIKDRIGSPYIQYGRLSWTWSNAGSSTLKLSADKANLIDGILIMNFGITTTGSGVAIVINDQVTNVTVYQNANAVSESLMSPFFYFVKGNELQFGTSVKCRFGFNYITVQGLNEKPENK